jgi:hypothetical protein
MIVHSQLLRCIQAERVQARVVPKAMSLQALGLVAGVALLISLVFLV